MENINEKTDENVSRKENKSDQFEYNVQIENFDLENFMHWEVYDPESGTAKSYLISKKDQTVSISELDLEVEFKTWETIHTEISQKYDDEVVNWLAGKAGLEVVTEFSADDHGYKNYLFKKN